MDLPERIVLPTEYVTSGATMLLIVLFRLSYPTTLLAMETSFGIKLEKISRIFNNGLAFLFNKYKDRLTLDVNMIQSRIDMYCQAISDKCGHLLGHCLGFIDAQLMRCARPLIVQEAV